MRVGPLKHAMRDLKWKEIMLPNDANSPWRERWREGRTGWDQGGPSAAMEQLLFHSRREGGLQAGAKIFSAGCGRAHNEAWLAQRGFQVEAVDVADEAIVAASQLYAAVEGLTLTVQDIFIGNSSHYSCDAVFDRAMLCALAPDQRAAYRDHLVSLLRPGGIIMAILFRKVKSPEGPPFAIDEAEAFRLLGADFDLCFASASPAPIEPRQVLDEWLCIWRKRELKVSP